MPSRGRGRSWGAPGRSWAVLGPSWALLGALLGRLGTMLRPEEPIGGNKNEKAKILILFGFGALCWPLGGVLGGLGGHSKPSLGRLAASWIRVGGYLEPSTAILDHLGGHLGLSEALLELSWAILGALILGPSWAPLLRKRPARNVVGGSPAMFTALPPLQVTCA